MNIEEMSIEDLRVLITSVDKQIFKLINMTKVSTDSYDYDETHDLEQIGSRSDNETAQNVQ